jgi:hypothetical protein
MRLKLSKLLKFVPKKTKVVQNENQPADESRTLPDEKRIDNVTSPRRALASAKKTKAPRKTTETARGTKTKTRAKSPSPAEPTDDEIRTRAYFISERRHRLALSGDAGSDWLEAKRQLLSESGPR